MLSRSFLIVAVVLFISDIMLIWQGYRPVVKMEAVRRGGRVGRGV